ncbi:hypothetical protein KAI87_13655, partial [Myxococcota bacterium]|nr:hypothetical protein [Myxococcota bacterium]
LVKARKRRKAEFLEDEPLSPEDRRLAEIALEQEDVGAEQSAPAVSKSKHSFKAGASLGMGYFLGSIERNDITDIQSSAGETVLPYLRLYYYGESFDFELATLVPAVAPVFQSHMSAIYKPTEMFGVGLRLIYTDANLSADWVDESGLYNQGTEMDFQHITGGLSFLYSPTKHFRATLGLGLSLGGSLKFWDVQSSQPNPVPDSTSELDYGEGEFEVDSPYPDAWPPHLFAELEYFVTDEISFLSTFNYSAIDSGSLGEGLPGPLGSDIGAYGDIYVFMLSVGYDFASLL